MQGQSSVTPLKEFQFESLLRMQSKIVSSIYSRSSSQFQYVHFDLNSGCGKNHDTGCDGSPLAFVEAFQDFPGKVSGHFVDSDQPAITELRSTLSTRESKANLHCYHEDNADFLRLKYSSLIGPNDFGSILLDPNNHVFPASELLEAITSTPKVDLFINIGFTVLKRMRATLPFKQRVHLIAGLLKCKRHWLIRKCFGRWQWSILVGRNTDKIDSWKAQEFHKLSDSYGFEILENAITTKEEREADPKLYLRELRRILADSGISLATRSSNGLAQQLLLSMW